MNRRVIFLFALIMSHWCVVSGGNLVVCPDCGNDVSRRAIMCPKCGCAGDVIRAEGGIVAVPTVTGSVLRVEFGNKVGAALPVRMDGRMFAVMALDDVLGMDRCFLFDGERRVEWTVPEVAVAAPIARFQIADTNLTYWSVGGVMMYDGARTVSVRTNLVAGVMSDLPSGRAEYRLDKCEWQVLQPREMNRHGRMLLRIRAGEALELPHKTHPYYKYLESQWRKENRE